MRSRPKSLPQGRGQCWGKGRAKILAWRWVWSRNNYEIQHLSTGTVYAQLHNDYGRVQLASD